MNKCLRAEKTFPSCDGPVRECFAFGVAIGPVCQHHRLRLRNEVQSEILRDYYLSRRKRTMKYNLEDQIKMINSLQEEAAQAQLRAEMALKEASQLTTELKDEVKSDQFVFEDKSYKFSYESKGFGLPGNRHWLRENKSVKVLG